MKQSSIKTLKGLCYAALFVIALGLVFLCIQSYYILTTGSGPGVINWDSPRIGLKLGIFIANRVSILILMGLFVAFVMNILKLCLPRRQRGSGLLCNQRDEHYGIVRLLCLHVDCTHGSATV